ncbi:MAG: M48 family metalloprotease [Deltaproteobacteria bacterium]
MCKIIQKQYFSLIMVLVLTLWGAQSVSAAFTIDDEKKLGKEIYDKLEKNNFLLQDKKLNAYVAGVGNRILAQSNKASFHYTFSIFNSSAINAFATPGGYIYINKGLLSTVENEAQLAGVMAHEIAHANARHVASIIEKSQKLNIAMMAAIVAGALLGGGGEATAAIAAFSVAGAQSMTLKYQREHEEEADRLGIGYLVNAGYYPAAMVEFLKIIKQYEFLSRTVPSYLRTHPGTDDRIFYLDSLLQTQYRFTGGAGNIVGNFMRMQALVAQDTDDLNKHRKQLMEALKKDPRNINLLYSLALTEDQLGHTTAALANLNKALTFAPQDEDILTHIGLMYLKTGDAAQARTHLFAAAKIRPENDEITFALGKAYFATGDYPNALKSFLKLQDKTFGEIDINYYIAMSYGRLNEQGESHYYFGLYFKKEKKKESALFHFRKALGFYPEGTQRAIAISDAIKELTADKPKKSNKKTDPQQDVPE